MKTNILDEYNLYDCIAAAKKLNCSEKTIRAWAKILFEKPFSFWVFSELQLKELKNNIKPTQGRPKKYTSV